MIGKVRTAIDDVLPEVDDDFSFDTDKELKQAILHSIENLLMEAPISFLEPTITSEVTLVSGSDDSGYIDLPADYLRFVTVGIKEWAGPIHELIERGSDDEKRQRSKWSRATNCKPRAMLDVATDNKRVIRCWPVASNSTVKNLVYIPLPKETEVGKITCALNPELEKNVIYLAAGLFLEGKKEHEAAEHFKKQSII